MAIRMASATLLNGLKSRADQADALILQLKHQIATLRTATALSTGHAEEERLKAENVALRQEMEKTRARLMVAEIRNGVRQIPIPQQRGMATIANQTVGGGSTTQTPPPAAKKEENAVAGQPEAKKLKKEAKQGKKGAEPGKKAEEQGKQGAEKASNNKGKVAKTEASGADGDRIDVSRLDFRIGRIIAVEKHPDADTLYVEKVDLGEETARTIVSGLVNNVPIEQMRNRLAVFMCNLKASKMRGIASEGMIMCAKDNTTVEILEPPSGVVPGDRITFDGYPGTPDKQLNPKKKIWETLKPDVRTDGERLATYKGVPFKVEGKGAVKAPTLANAEIS